jgi:hypothetical protein
MVREMEYIFRRLGHWVAEQTSKPECLPLPELIGKCLPRLGFINNLFGNGPEVQRLREVVAHEYEARARERGAQNEVMVATLNALLATGMLKGMASAAASQSKGLGNIGSHGTPIDPSTALSSGTKWLGPGYREIAPGVYRSADGLRQFRMTSADLVPMHGNIGSHVHFEVLDETGMVIENLHLPVGR